MAAFTALLGAKLQSKDGEVDTAKALEGKKAVGLYFSAHWCPPCRGFTPKLAEFYNDGLQAAGMEIIFVSSDRDEDSFKEYFGEMPWLSLPFADREAKARLSKKFKVSGIPMFIVLDGEGKVTCKDGRAKVMSDPKGVSMPWAPKGWTEVIGDKFVKADGSIVGKEALAGKTLMIYFSAHWCPPCRGFTPKLAAHYKTYKEKGLAVECIFSTGDRDKESFESYHKEMAENGGDWLAVPFEDSARNEELNALFEVQGIPALVIVDENGKVINANGRGVVGSDPAGDNFPWAPPPVKDLAQPEGIEESVSICVLMESVPAEQQKTNLAEMETVSKKYIADAGDDDPKYIFFAGKTSEGPVPQIRTMCELPAPGEKPVMVLLDLDDDGAFYKSEDVEITKETINKLIEGYEKKTLARQQLKK